MLVIPVGLWNPHLLGGSHDLIMYVTQMFSRGNWLSIAGLLGIFLVLRFAGTMIAYGSTVPGGIFMPIFVLGSILGALAGVLMIHAGVLPASCCLNMVAIGMAAYFGAAEGGAISRHPARHRNGRQYQSDFSDDPANLRCLLHQYAARGADVKL